MKTTGILTTRRMRGAMLRVLLALVATAIFVPFLSYAEEGGSGHYTPGASASFMDALPSKPGLAIASYFSYYSGNADASKQLPFGGSATAGLDATAYAETVVALYRTDLTLLGGYYVVGVAIPYVWMDVKGNVQITGPGGTVTRAKSDTANGIGDVTVYPFMLGWTGLGGDVKYDLRLGIYVPTGSYNMGDLANVGKNYWTFEPMVTLSYFSHKTGFELSAFAGLDFNTKNNDTDYQTGNQFHIDVTAAQHLPFLGGLIGVGANGFYYEQISGDSGSGAVLGDMMGRTMGIGPVLSYVTNIWKKDVAAEVKWLPELDVSNRTKGNYIWFKLEVQF
jgi:hypothetical protein